MIHHKRTNKKGLATAEEVALAACRAMMRSAITGDEQSKRATVLARFALAMKSQATLAPLMR